jgi:hypothetical protein
MPKYVSPSVKYTKSHVQRLTLPHKRYGSKRCGATLQEERCDHPQGKAKKNNRDRCKEYGIV